MWVPFGTGALAGKMASVFVTTGTQGGGQETTALTAVTQLAHHGMIFVPTVCRVALRYSSYGFFRTHQPTFLVRVQHANKMADE